MTTLQQGLKDIAIAVASGSGGILLTAGGGISLGEWGDRALSSTKTLIPPFATVAVGGATRAASVDGGAIMAIPLDREQVIALRDACAMILKEEVEIDRFGGSALLIEHAEAATRWLQLRTTENLDRMIEAIKALLPQRNETDMSETDVKAKTDRLHELRETSAMLEVRRQLLEREGYAAESVRRGIDDLNREIAALEDEIATFEEPLESTELAVQGDHTHPAVERMALAMNVHVEDGQPVEDALAAAINHDLKLRETLTEDLRKARMVVNRLAAIHGVTKWNADGDEIVEKAQRWAGFAGAIKRRLKGLLAVGTPSYSSAALREARVSELSGVYTMLTGPADLSAWVASMPTEVSNRAMVEAVDLPPGTPGTDPDEDKNLTASHVRSLMMCIESRSPGAFLDTTGRTITEAVVALSAFRAVLDSQVSMDALLNLFNLVILPRARRKTVE